MQLINNTHYTHYQCQLHHFSQNDVIKIPYANSQENKTAGNPIDYLPYKIISIKLKSFHLGKFCCQSVAIFHSKYSILMDVAPVI